MPHPGSVLNALIEGSDRLHERQGAAPWSTSSAEELAVRLHEDAVSAASSLLSELPDAGRLDGGNTGEVAREPRLRAVYRPHPDDPPRD